MIKERKYHSYKQKTTYIKGIKEPKQAPKVNSNISIYSSFYPKTNIVEAVRVVIEPNIHPIYINNIVFVFNYS